MQNESIGNTERWKKIKQYPRYEVSTLGNVRMIGKETNLSGSRNKSYHQVNVTDKNGQKKKVLAHRLVAEAFIANPLNKRCTNHKNGVKDDNRVVNLEWATHTENLHHAYRTGLRKKHSGLPLLTYRHETQLNLFI